jgi:hypothetical protein
MNSTTCLLLTLSVTLLACPVNAGDDTAKTSAAALERGDAVVIGKLRQPLGTLAGSRREPREAGQLENVLVVDEVSAIGNGPGAIALGMGVDLEMRGLPLEKGKRYRLSGYESGEFVATRKDGVEQKERTQTLRFRSFFVVMKVLEPAEDRKRVDVADIKIAFAKQRVAPADGVPKEARHASPGPDASDHGPLSKRVDGKIAALNVTWADPARFSAEKQTADFLRQRLSSRRGHSYTFQIWSQVLAAPMLAADVEHVGGKPGRLLVWPYGETPAQDTAALYVYLDGEGNWWFGDWQDLKANGDK